MGENAIDPMKIDEFQAKLAQAQGIIFETTMELKAKNTRLEEKNKEVEKFQKLNEESQTTIDSLIEGEEIFKNLSISENEKLRERLEEKETESVLAQNKVKKLEREIAECRARQERASRNIKTDVEEIRQNVVQIIEQLCHLEVEADSLVEMERGGELGRTAESSPQTEVKAKEVEELKGGEDTSVLILGGWSSVNTIYLLDSKAQSWKKLKITLPVEMRDFGAVVFNEELYIFGGYSKDAYHQHCYKLKDDGSWMKLASLNQIRSAISSSCLIYKGDIRVIGGYYNGSSLKSVEKYDISQNKWTYMPEMNSARHSAAVAVFNDRIFVTGGWNEEKLKSMEMFDPELQKWILFCALPIEVGGHTMLINNSTLYIFGGYSESGPLTSVWGMDIEEPEKKWTKKQSFKHPRSDFGIGKLSNGIIVFGGEEIPDDTFSDEDTNDESGKTSEIFDGNEWIDGPKLPQELARFAYTFIPRSLEEKLLDKFP